MGGRIHRNTHHDRRTIGSSIKTVQFRWPLGLPLVRKLDGALWEVRVNISNGRAARIFFTVKDAKMVLLHGIIKKSNTTPKAALKVAKQRKIRWMQGEQHEPV